MGNVEQANNPARLLYRGIEGAETMNRQIKIIQVSNGYIVAFLDYSGTSKIFKTFADLMDYLFDYFDEKRARS